MPDRIFRKIYQLKDLIASYACSIAECEKKKRALDRDISSMTLRLETRKLELARREGDGETDHEPNPCGKKCPSGYMPDCNYRKGHSGVCEGQYDPDCVRRVI